MDITQQHDRSGRAALQSFVRASAWAAGVRPDALNRLIEATTLRELEPGDVLCRQGERPTHWYGVVEGLLRMDVLCQDGAGVTLTAGPVGTWFGEAALTLGEPRIYEVSALRASRVACMSALAFFEALREDAEFNRAMLRSVSSRMHYFLELFARERGLDPDRRIAGILVTLAGNTPQGCAPQLDISQEELAQLAGVARQRVNQALRALQERGLIEVAYASVKVLDLHGLSAA